MILYSALLFASVVFRNNVCGFPERKSDRIVGGRRTSITTLPYQAQLLQNNIQICGATILSPTWVLTAAHCIDKSSPKWTVMTGSEDASTGGENHELKRPPIVHPNYNRAVTDNDIALLELASPIMMNERQKSIPLATRYPQVGDKITVSGFGKLGEYDAYSDKLMVAMAPVVDANLCQQRYFPEPITDNMFCAGLGGTDSCQGDSGGPAVINNELVGVVSFGKGCAHPQFPGVYTKVRNYIDWILANTKTNEPTHNPMSGGFQHQVPNPGSTVHINIVTDSMSSSQSISQSQINTNLNVAYPNQQQNNNNHQMANAKAILDNIFGGKVHIHFD